MRCMVVTMVRMAMARNKTGRMDAMVLPSFTSPIASDQDTVSSLDRISRVLPRALSACSTKAVLSKADFTLI